VGVALEAARLLRERGVAFRMVIGGGGEYEAGAREEIARGNLDDVVELAGTIAPEEVSGFFSRADAFIFPDLTQPAFGLVAVEAMLHGLPVIAARSGAIPEVVDDVTGWIYQRRSSAELATIMERLARSPEEIRLKAAAGRTRALQFTSEAMARRMAEVYAGI
jgi:glycosyltransferase involved in cell wall biosynthesis